MTINNKALFLFFLLTWVTPPSYAGLLVDRAVVVFEGAGSQREDIAVINDDPDNRLFVSVEAYEVQHPGSENEKLVPITKGQQPAFIASPNKLVVPPGGRNTVRLIKLTDDETSERVYRINFRPIARPAEVPAMQGEPTISSMLDVVIAYQVLALVQPAEPIAQPNVSRIGKLATFDNRGNSNYLLARGQQCRPSNPDDCVELPSRRVYPGNRWTLELPFDGPFSYTIRTINGYSSSRFN